MILFIWVVSIYAFVDDTVPYALHHLKYESKLLQYYTLVEGVLGRSAKSGFCTIYKYSANLGVSQ